MSVIHRLALVGAATLVASCQQSEATATANTTVETPRGAAADKATRPAPTRSAPAAVRGGAVVGWCR